MAKGKPGAPGAGWSWLAGLLFLGIFTYPRFRSWIDVDLLTSLEVQEP